MCSCLRFLRRLRALLLFLLLLMHLLVHLRIACTGGVLLPGNNLIRGIRRPPAPVSELAPPELKS